MALQGALNILQNSGVDLEKSGNPFGMLALAQQVQQMQGGKGRSKSELMNVLRGESQPDQFMSYSDALSEMNKRYEKDPDSFNNKELLEIKKYATLAGKEFDINFSGKRAAKRAGMNFLDMMAMGFISDDYIDKVAPALTGGEKIAGSFGSLAGFASPMMLGGKIASAGVKGLGKLASGNTSGIAGIAGRAGRVIGKRSSGRALGDTAGKASQGVAKWLTSSPARIANVEKALQFGSASAITSLYDEGVSGAIANGLGGMTLGAAGSALAKTGFKTKVLAGAIYGGLTKPEQESTSEEHIEHVLKVLWFAGMFGGGKGKSKNSAKSGDVITPELIKSSLNKVSPTQRRMLLAEGKGIALNTSPLQLGQGPLRLNARPMGLPPRYMSHGSAMPMGGVIPLQGTIPLSGKTLNMSNGEQLSLLNLLR